MSVWRGARSVHAMSLPTRLQPCAILCKSPFPRITSHSCTANPTLVALSLLQTLPSV